MKKFTFRLESVLNVREEVEKEKQIALSSVHKLVVEHEDRLMEAYRILEDARGTLREEERDGRIDVEAVKTQRVYIGTLKRRISEVVKRLRKLEIELAQRRDEAVQARKDRKVLEMLKGRRRAEYVYEADRAEQAELDDVASRQDAGRRVAEATEKSS